MHSRDVTFHENVMLTSGKDIVASPTSTGDIKSTREKVEFEIVLKDYPGGRCLNFLPSTKFQ